MRSLMLLACLWSGSALAEVAEQDWPDFVGHEVRLVNPSGKQIEGTILSAEGDEIVIRRTRDDREFTIPKSDVDSCEKLRPTAKKVVEGAKKQTREAASEVAEELDQEADRAVDRTGEVIENLGEKIQGTDEEPALAAPAEETEPTPVAEGAEAEAQAQDTSDAVEADQAAPELERPVLAEGKTYADGLRAGRLEAAEVRMLTPFAVGAGATCATTTLCVGGCGPLGGCVGVASGAAAPIYYGGVRPYTLKDDLAAEVVNEPTEYAAGYVRGYTDELQRKETVMATAGSVAGLVTGAVLGTGVYLAVSAAISDTPL